MVSEGEDAITGEKAGVAVGKGLQLAACPEGSGGRSIDAGALDVVQDLNRVAEIQAVAGFFRMCNPKVRRKHGGVAAWLTFMTR